MKLDKEQIENKFDDIGLKVDALIDRCHKLQEENTELVSKINLLETELRIKSQTETRCFEQENLISAFKKAEDRDSIIIRFYNPTYSNVKAEITVPGTMREVYKVNLNEERLEKIETFKGKCLEVSVPPKKICTLELITTVDI